MPRAADNKILAIQITEMGFHNTSVYFPLFGIDTAKEKELGTVSNQVQNLCIAA